MSSYANVASASKDVKMGTNQSTFAENAPGKENSVAVIPSHFST
jgi:hypothetical protein